jgi:MFS family permease
MPTRVLRLLVSHALAAVAMSLPWPLLLVLVWARVGHTPHGDLLFGLTGAARLLPYVALSWATGMLADRLRRDRLLKATLFARLLLLVGVAVAVSQQQLVLAVAAATLAVACGTPAYPALAAAMPAVAGDSRRRATDVLVTIEVASFVVGPALGGLLLAPATRTWGPWLAVAMTVAATALVLDVELPRLQAVAERVTSPIAAMRASTETVRAVGLAGLLNAVDAALLLALLPLAEGQWGSGETGYGIAAAVLGFGALATPLLWWLGRSAPSRARLGLLLLCVALASVTLSPGLMWAVLPLAVAGAATVHVEGALTETIQDAVPDAARAGVLGLTDSVMVGAALVSSLVTPWLATVLGARQLVALLAAVSLAGALVVKGRRRGRAPAPAIPEQRRPEQGRPVAQSAARADA